MLGVASDGLVAPPGLLDRPSDLSQLSVNAVMGSRPMVMWVRRRQHARAAASLPVPRPPSAVRNRRGDGYGDGEEPVPRKCDYCGCSSQPHTHGSLRRKSLPWERLDEAGAGRVPLTAEAFSWDRRRNPRPIATGRALAGPPSLARPRFQVAWRNRSQLRFLPHAGSATGRSCAAHTPAYRAAASSYTRCYLTDLGAGGAPDHRVRASMRALSRSRTAGFKSRPIRAIFSSVASARLARGGSGRSRRTCRGRARGAAGRRRSKVAPLRQSESGPRQTLPRRQPPPACRMSSSIMRR